MFQLVDEQDIKTCFGSTNEMLNYIYRTDCGYLLFYQDASLVTTTINETIPRRKEANDAQELQSNDKQAYCL